MNAPTKSLQIPAITVGQAWTGRVSKNQGHVIIVDEIRDDGEIVVRHVDTSARRAITPAVLFSYYRLASESEAAAVATVDGADALKTNATPKASAGRRAKAQRGEVLPSEAGTVAGVAAQRAYVDVAGPSEVAAPTLRDLASTRILEAIEAGKIHLDEAGAIFLSHGSMSKEDGLAISQNAAMVSDCASGKWEQIVSAWPGPLVQRWREAYAANLRTGQSAKVAAWQAFVDLSGRWKWMPRAESAPPNNTTDATFAPQTGVDVRTSGTSPTAAHFGPDPLPEQAERIEFRGHIVPGYTSRKDGSKWLVARSVIAYMNIGQDRLFRALKRADRNSAAKPHVQCSYNSRTVPKWLVSVEFLARFLDADAAKASLAKEPEAHVEPPCPVQPVADAPHADSEVAGQVPDGMMLVKLNGVPVALSGGAGDEGKIIDSDLASFIGVDGIRQFRQRLRDYEKSGDLVGLDWRPFDGRQSTGNGGTRAFKSTMALLTMEQALFMVAKSNSPRANEMTRHIIGVFLEVQRRGMVQTQTQPQLDVAQVVAAAVSQTVRTVVPEILAAVRAEGGANNPKAAEDAKAAEAERKRKENIAKKGTETKAFNERFDGGIRQTYEPLLVRFIDQNLESVDLRDPKAQSRCLTPEQIRVAFGEWLRDTRVHKAAILPPENRAVFTMLSILSGGVAIYTKVDGKNEVKLYPWAFKSGAIVDPRQTTIPGVGGK